MHLKTIRIRGFKSFPDALELSLEPGVAVIVGPNGSGKSNIADAVVWAAGSLTPSEMRAEKPDDVLFAGGGERKRADHCEVELVFDNEAGSFTELDFSEVSVARRLVRGAEGQYLVNRAPVRRTDLVELLSDVGLGSAMHSIVGQGKVEQVLASKPEDRRALVEEAAGLGKFKRRRHRAELKLARVALQVERARDVEDEVRKRLRPLALQATAAERAEKLAGEIAALRARVAELDLEAAGQRRSEAESRREQAALVRRGVQGRLEGLLADRARAEDELSDAAGKREGALSALYRLQGGGERLALRGESAASLDERLRGERAAIPSSNPGAADAAQLERIAHETALRAREATRRAREPGRACPAGPRANARSGAGPRGAGRASACRPRARRARSKARARRARGHAGRRARGRRGAPDASVGDPRLGSRRRARAARTGARVGPREPHRARWRTRRSNSSTTSPSSRSSRCSTRPCRRSRPRASATTRPGASSGSQARPRRPCCSSSRRAGATSQRRRATSRRSSPRPRVAPQRPSALRPRPKPRTRGSRRVIGVLRWTPRRSIASSA